MRFNSFLCRDQKVLSSGPHTFFGKPMVVKAWTPTFHFHQELLRVIPLWVRLPNLPLHCWSEDSLSRIGSILGVPLFADACTSQKFRVSFARLLIEMDVTHSLPTEIQIVDGARNSYSQQVLYGWKPPFCTPCNKVGHNYALVNKDKPPKPKIVQKWLPKAVQANVPAVSRAATTVEPPAPNQGTRGSF